MKIYHMLEFILFIFFVVLIALADQSPSGDTSESFQPLSYDEASSKADSV